MTTRADASGSDDGRVNEAIAAYLKAVDEGRAPDRGEFLASHPDLKSELEGFFNDDDKVNQLAQAWRHGQDFARPFGPGTTRSDAPTVEPGSTWDHGRVRTIQDFSELREVGDYELLREIGRGGMGVVYVARRRALGMTVALKLNLAGTLASPADIRRFRAEAEAIANLDHPNIVPIYEVGEYRGQWFFSMKLIDGGSLADQLSDFQDKPRAVARLMVTVARAMHHAHQRGILHRDLKPSNILLDAAGQPHVVDFGLAKRDNDPIELTASGAIIGSPPYMAPELAEGRKGAATTATDVYGLGTILYALLTGRPPFSAETTLETIRRVRECEPEPPRTGNTALDRNLETICLKCLNKDPQHRYGSADALANDLERWLADKPILARPISVAEKLWLWGRRNPAVALLSVLTGCLLIALTITAVVVARRSEAMLVQEAGRSNLYVARHVASTVLWELRKQSLPVAKAADDPILASLLEHRDREGLQHYVDQAYQTNGVGFETWYILDAQGTLLAVTPMKQAIRDRDFSGRDYFQGAMLHASAPPGTRIHISRLFQAENDGLYKLAITAPVLAQSGSATKPLGVIAATITTTATLGTQHLDDQQRTVVLVGRRDTNPPRGHAAGRPVAEALILRHPAYRHGDEAVQISVDRLPVSHQARSSDEFQLPELRPDAELERAIDSNYRDPLGARAHAFAGRWLAGFARVGSTDLAVIVQRRYDDAIAPSATVILDFLLWAGCALVVGLLLFGITGYSVQHSFARRAHKAR